MLAAVAALLVWLGWGGDAGPSAVGWIGALSAFQLLVLIGGLVLLGLLAGQGWFLLHLLRQNGRLLVRVEALEDSFGSGEAPASSQNAAASQPTAGLPIGTTAPAFSLGGLYGETLTLDSLRDPEKPVVLLFTDPNCGPCTAMLPEIGRWQEEHSEKLTISLISRGDPEENRTKASEHGLASVLLQDDWEISEAYQVRGTPSAVVVLPDGTMGSAVVAGSEPIKGLVERAARTPDQLPARPTPQAQPCPNCGKAHPGGGAAGQPVLATRKVGEPAPEVELPALEGGRSGSQTSGARRRWCSSGTRDAASARGCSLTSSNGRRAGPRRLPRSW